MEENKFNDECERAKSYVKVNERQLREIYGDSYVAVHPRGRVVDWDLDEFSLAKRVHLDYPGEFILVNTIDEIVNPTTDCLFNVTEQKND